MLTWAVLSAWAVLLALFICRLTKRPLLAAVGTALIVTAVFQLIARVQLGYTDPFWLIATAVSFGGTFAVALITAILWNARRPADRH